MKKQTFYSLLWLLLVLALAACSSETPAADPTAVPDTAAEPTAAPAETDREPFTIGLIMVGPRDDRGWNQAHWDSVEYVAEKMGAEVVWFDKLNPADNPDLTVEQVVDDLVAQGADLIIANSAEMREGATNAAKAHPEVYFIHASGDAVLNGDAPANLSNVMGQMEYGKMMAGCAAAMTTETGQLAYLGALIDAETRRLVNSAYLGARYCWENVRGNDPADLSFRVVWIGFWFNIPGVTLDPTQVVNDFFDGGADVVLSGIDTTEAIVVAGQRAAAGEAVFAVPYDYETACDVSPEVCLGVPYFNWGPDYLRFAQAAQAGTWEQQWLWVSPDWSDINNPDTSMIGWVDGPALGDEAKAAVATLITGFADGSINLYTGPLNYQDGSEFVAENATALDEQIWYTEQLLEGIDGVSE